MKETSERTSRARLSFPVNGYKVRRRRRRGRKGEGKGEEGWVSGTAEREALIEFGFVWIIVKRLKRPETNLFASGRESFLVEDNK